MRGATDASCRADSQLCLLLDGQSLALRPLARAPWGAVPLRPADGQHAHPTLATGQAPRLPEPADRIEHVNLPQTEAELEAIRRCVLRGSPYGNAFWTEQAAEQLGLQSTLDRRAARARASSELRNLRILPSICVCPLYFPFFNHLFQGL